MPSQALGDGASQKGLRGACKVAGRPGLRGADSRYKCSAGLLTYSCYDAFPNSEESVAKSVVNSTWNLQQRELYGILTRFPFNLMRICNPRRT